MDRPAGAGGGDERFALAGDLSGPVGEGTVLTIRPKLLIAFYFTNL